MKNLLKISFLIAASVILAGVGKLSAQNQFLDHELVCWDSAGIITPILVRTYVVNGVGQSKEYRRLDTFAKVVPTVGTVGACVQSDTIINRLDQIVTASDSLVSLQNFAVTTEVGCLTIGDTTGCNLSGLAVWVGGIPTTAAEVSLNDTLTFFVNNATCEQLAAGFNANDRHGGSWGCCNDSLVVNSTNNTLYDEIKLRFIGLNQTVIRPFADTITQNPNATGVPVEIIKVIDKTGEILAVRVYSPDGNTEYTDLTGLSTGPCQQPQADVRINLMLDSFAILLDSLLTVTEEPQICDCIYSIDLKNHTATIGDNQKQITWGYDRVVTRNCGAGAVEIFRAPGYVLANKVYHSYPVSGLINGSGVIDSMIVHAKNPEDTITIYLSPTLVEANYTGLTIDTADLRYNSASPSTMAAALTSVINYALNNWAATHVPTLPTPDKDLSVTADGSGNVTIHFYVINNPSGTYVNINNSWGPLINYHRNASTPISSSGLGYNGSGGFKTETYSTPCGSTASVGYTASTSTSANTLANWDAIIPINPPTTAKGSQTDRTCTQPCPESDGCVSICDTVMVKIVNSMASGSGSSSDTCLVQNIIEFPVTATGNSVSLAANYYHSISISVTSGTVSITAVNGSNITTQTFSAGQSISLSASDCQLIKTGLGVNATGGAAVVATTR